ncbi:hypothetical protein [Streptomyces sp. NRRL S-1022]|uniref:hypothetical protein n=1 Tax=Streptomyces sp. NRRL S-1022 TaxID=1463880 RepID=UPI0004C0843D|nr:hypothetical protein [Streptomyces sp. NRRL S-1022]
MPDTALVRRALYVWAYNRNRWDETPPDDVARAAKVLDHTRERASSRIDAALREWNEPERSSSPPGGRLGDTH